jgi:hypothetical protein
MVNPIYVRAGEREKRITVTVIQRSERQHIVRVWGALRPDKVSKIADIRELELRAGPAETAIGSIPPQPHPYWLAIEVFRETEAGWTRCIWRRRDGVEVPHSVEFDRDDISLDLVYS